MKGDFTRDTFSAAKHYQAVLMQQGRAQLDADWNEQAALATRRDETTARDLVGRCGGPLDNAAFGIMLHGPGSALALTKDFYLSAGRYYVDGVQCEVEAPVLFSQQPHRGAVEAIEDDKVYLLYLDVWRRHVTALEDPAIRETALGGPDTGTRVQTVWQARLHELTKAEAEGMTCGAKFPSFDAKVAASTGTLRAFTTPESKKPDPCSVPASAGYSGLENQLYRVEIHREGKAGTATYKWSRDNGTVVTAVLGIQGKKLTVATLGPDEALGFAKDQWVELIDDTLEWERQPGQLTKIADIPTGGTVIELTDAPTAPLAGLTTPELATRHVRLRRWDGTGTVPTEGARKLESGIGVQFSPDPKATYHTGDYWIIPARAATAQSPTGDIEWPKTAGANASLPPHGIRHHYCRLGLLWTRLIIDDHGPENRPKPILRQLLHTDCRCLWEPLTMPQLEYVGGDGQEVMPDLALAAAKPPALFRLPQPLTVRVTNLACCQQTLTLRFKVIGGKGALLQVTGSQNHHEAIIPSPGASEVLLKKASDFVAFDWYLDGETPAQQVEVALVDEKGGIVIGPLLFNAHLSVARQVAYLPEHCPQMAAAKPPVKTVHDALEFLCQHRRCCEIVVDPSENLASIVKREIELGRNDICLCLRGGPKPHRLPDGWKFTADPKSQIHLRLVGCGRGARLLLGGPIMLEGLVSVTLRDLEIDATFTADKVVFGAGGSDEFTMTGCKLRGVVPSSVLLYLAGVNRIRLRDSVLEAAPSLALDRYVKLLEAEALKGIPAGAELRDLFSDCRWTEFPERAAKPAEILAKLPEEQRKAVVKRLVEVLLTEEWKSSLSRGESQCLRVLAAVILAPNTTTGFIANALRDVRTAALRTGGADALVIVDLLRQAGEAAEFADLDAGSSVVLEANEILGQVSLSGPSTPPPEDWGIVDQAAKLFREKPPQVGALGGTFHLTGNRLTRLTLAQPVLEKFAAAVAAGQSSFIAPFSRNLITDNVIDGAGNLLAAALLSLNGNQFTLSAEPPLPLLKGFESKTRFTRSIGDVLPVVVTVARQTVFVGNSCLAAGAALHAENRFAQSANLGLVF